ncbi:MAG TPA: putative Na+/H+ antiporter [Anaeromyxobacteraceae bacterium]|nr:putative Na+/H+ antiporter [Anaeromyxobacteraceae bacterium]
MTPPAAGSAFPLPLDAYAGDAGLPLAEVLSRRAAADPLNVVAAALFLCAIVHTFLAPALLAASHRLRHRLHAERGEGAHSIRVELLHLLGEIEVVFGAWVAPLLLVLAWREGPRAPERFLGDVHFTEPVFVVVIMAVASSRPVLAFAEAVLGAAARAAGGSPRAWWLAVLTLGPLLGSLVTEPAAMVISALLLSRRVLALAPSAAFRYATLGLLFVNVSVGGTLTHFAAPPVLMVAGRFGWSTPFMLSHFGWKAALGIVVSNAVYALAFRRELSALAERARDVAAPPPPGVPAWIVGVHVAFLALLVYASHSPAVLIGAFLFFLAFHRATAPHQQPLDLRSPLLVGFFLAGLVIHGAGQAWWIEPVLSRLDALPLFFGATVLTAFNDNAAITYLASLVPSFTPALQYAVVTGAVTGGGLTVIANAPNPAGQATLASHFPDGVKPSGLLLGALLPTVVVGACFLLL